MKPPKAGTTIKPAPTKEAGVVEIYHSQDAKQSLDWQSAGSSYGVKITCHDNPADIAAAIDRAERIVEKRLLVKIEEQRGLLEKLSRLSHPQ